MKFDFQRKFVLMDGNKEYTFPKKITSFMRSIYRRPAIYRWNIFRKEPGDEKLIYIGEA